MTRHEQLVENYESALFELLMEGVIEREGEKFEAECEQLKNDPEFLLPPELDRRCLASIRRACIKKRRRQSGKKAYGVLSKVAVVLLVVLVLVSSAFAAFPSVRAGVLNLIIEVSDISTTMRLEGFQREDTQGESRASLSSYSYSGIPDGFALVNRTEAGVTARDYYENGDGAYIAISIMHGQNAIHGVNTEDAVSVDEISAAGFTGLLIDRGDEIIIALADTDEGYFITLAGGGVEAAALIEIAGTFIFNK